ncbi:MAG: Glyoxalase [Parcubacteria group bacterium GW2011_GWA1_59_11]|nr:MAG: Glyoxalase [Parcubacteria group bacterium GW2011_GWA1_59_11]
MQHISLNVSDLARSKAFYKEVLGYLGFHVKSEGKDYIGLGNGMTGIWLSEAEPDRKGKLHRKNPGVNHLAFRAESREEVERFAEFLKEKGIPALYGSPRLFPEYGKDYYAVYFEDPDRLKLELVSGESPS